MKKLYLLFIFFYLSSCGYPDIDNVPNFNEVLKSTEEISDYCSSIHTTKKNIEICINDYKSKY